MTLGVEFASKVLFMPDNSKIKLQIWDTVNIPTINTLPFLGRAGILQICSQIILQKGCRSSHSL